MRSRSASALASFLRCSWHRFFTISPHLAVQTSGCRGGAPNLCNFQLTPGNPGSFGSQARRSPRSTCSVFCPSRRRVRAWRATATLVRDASTMQSARSGVLPGGSGRRPALVGSFPQPGFGFGFGFVIRRENSHVGFGERRRYRRRPFFHGGFTHHGDPAEFAPLVGIELQFTPECVDLPTLEILEPDEQPKRPFGQLHRMLEFGDGVLIVLRCQGARGANDDEVPVFGVLYGDHAQSFRVIE